MARIPIFEAPQVATAAMPTPFQAEDHRSPLHDLAKGVGELGKVGEEAYFKAKAEADGVAANNGLTEYQNDSNGALDGRAEPDVGTGVPGDKPNPSAFLSTRGTEAAEKSVPTLEYLEQRRREIAEGLSNDEQRKLFLKHSATIYQGARSRIERHTQQQREVAREASIESRMATTLHNIANNYADDGQVAKQEEDVATVVRAFSAPMGNADAKVQAWREKVAEVRMNQFISANDLDGAETLFARAKETLGPHAAQFQKTIETMKQDRQGEAAAVAAVEAARDPETKRVDPAKAFAEIDKISDVRIRDEARGRVGQRVAVAEKDWRQKVNNVADSALNAYIEGGNDLAAVSKSEKTWLLQNAPEEWRKLQMMSRADQQHEMAGRVRHETPETRAALLDVRTAMAERPDDFRTMTPSTFHREWSGKLSDTGFAEASRIFAEIHKTPKGTEAEFSRFVGDEVKGNEALKNKTVANQFKAYMGDLRRDFVRTNKHEPGLADMEEMKAKAWKTTVEKGWLWNSDVPAFQNKHPLTSEEQGNAAPAATPAAPKLPKRDRVLQLSKSGKSVKEITAILNQEGY